MGKNGGKAGKGRENWGKEGEMWGEREGNLA